MRRWGLRKFVLLLWVIFVISKASAVKFEILSYAPVLINGVVVGPAKEIAEVIQADFSFDGNKITFEKDRKQLTLFLGKKIGLLIEPKKKNVRKITLQEEPKIVLGDRLIVPYAIARVFDIQVSNQKDGVLINGKLIPYQTEPKWFLVKLPEQKIYRYLGPYLIDSSRVCTGNGWHTKNSMKYQPEYTIVKKEGKNARAIIPGKYNSPTPYKFYFSSNKPRVRMHGFASVPNHPTSHGCIRLPISYAKKIYDFVEEGKTKVYLVIHSISEIKQSPWLNNYQNKKQPA